ncbi:hypothetical protein E6P78_10905 [Streptomyces sp. A0958]|nr:hypothetical protein E6P78_10905 [Streptomyces sp. A0958]
MGEPGAWGEVVSGLGVSRPVLVARLLVSARTACPTKFSSKAGERVMICQFLSVVVRRFDVRRCCLSGSDDCVFAGHG